MRPLTDNLPKILLPISGAAFLDHQLSWLHRQGVTRVVFCLGHLSHLVLARLKTTPLRDVMDLRISDERQQKLGTAGAVRLAIENGLLEDFFLTLYGDTFPQFDLRSAVDLWQASGLRGMLTVYRPDSKATIPSAFVEGGRVTEFLRDHHCDKRQPTHSDYGVSGFQCESFQHLPVGVRSGFASLHQELARAGQLAAVELDHPPFEIGSHAGYRALQSMLKGCSCRPPAI